MYNTAVYAWIRYSKSNRLIIKRSPPVGLKGGYKEIVHYRASVIKPPFKSPKGERLIFKRWIWMDTKS